MRRYNCLTALLVALFSLAGLVGPAAAASPSTAVFFPATQHALSEPYLSQWLNLGGADQIGDPVSEVVEHDQRQAQFFQYGVLVKRSTSTISRLRVGELLLEATHQPDAARSDTRRIGSKPTSAAFVPVAVPLDAEHLTARTAFRVDPSVADAYGAKGGLEFLGQPISAAYVDSGKTIQWFEYGRLELVDGISMLGPVGYELAVSLGIDVSPIDRGDTPLYDPTRFYDYRGDGTFPNATAPFVPTRISIPKIAINSTVESVSITDGIMGVPQNAWNVGWYSQLSTPGDGGNVVVAGHRDWWGVGPVVFWNLYKLAPGDKIYLIGADGVSATYQVTMNWLVDANIDAGLLTEDIGLEAITLITCGGTFNGTSYDSRQVIRAVRI